MNNNEIIKIVSQQRAYFNKGFTLEVNLRIKYLKKLKQVIKNSEENIEKALYLDLNKSATESYMCEIGMVYSELNYMLKHVRSFAKKKHVRTPIAQAISKSYVIPSPFGVTLIMSPWNYPFLLSIDPLIDALAAGNTIVLKPSAYAPNTSKIITEIVHQVFPGELVEVITGGRQENQTLLEQNFDYIFFTGSKNVGKEVLRHASEHLTPVTLELGGKSPCIIDETADIKITAKRIVFGKFLNAGQTCVAPDYIVCHQTQVDALLNALKTEIELQFSTNPLNNLDYCKIINLKHFKRLLNLMQDNNLYYGGQSNLDELKINPTLIYPCSENDSIMQEEIFGPILPILVYENLENLIDKINQKETPLALYIFSRNQQHIDYVLSHAHFGGASVNETVMHLASPYMGFGGLKESGMGAYHGKNGFDTFTHYKSIIDKKTWFDLPMRYQPFASKKHKLIKFFLK